MADYLRVEADNRNGRCVLRVTGDLDMTTAAEFACRAEAAVTETTGPVVLDLSGLTFIDVRGARALAAVMCPVPAARRPVVRSCAPHVRLVLDMLDLPFSYLPADYLPAYSRTAPPSATRDLVKRVQQARLNAGDAKLSASRVLARLTDTSIRLASTRERTGLILEQGQQTLASTRAARELVIRSRH
jgi:anti-anti-sigma factor